MTKQDKDLKEWFAIGARTGKKIGESHSFAAIFTKNFLNSPECALQLGYAILMDKPIVLIADKNVKIPESLVKIAKLIERVDMSKPSEMARASKSLAEFTATIN